MEIHNFSKSDISSIAGLMRRMADFHHGLDSEYKAGEGYKDLEVEIEGWLADADILVLVAEEGGEAVGYIRISVEPAPAYLDEKKIGLVDDIFVTENYRRQGIAELLFAKAKEWFSKKGARSVELNVDVRNKDAIKLWKKLGFNEQKLRMRMGSNRE